MPRPRVTFSRNGTTSSGPSGSAEGDEQQGVVLATGSGDGHAADPRNGGRPRAPRRVADSRVNGFHSRDGAGYRRSVLTRLRRHPATARCVRACRRTGFVARFPMSMIGLGEVLLVSSQTGSYALAGALSAVGALANAVFGPMFGRAVDRFGQSRVLPVLVTGARGVPGRVRRAGARRRPDVVAVRLGDLLRRHVPEPRRDDARAVGVPARRRAAGAADGVRARVGARRGHLRRRSAARHRARRVRRRLGRAGCGRGAPRRRHGAVRPQRAHRAAGRAATRTAARARPCATPASSP